MKNKWIIALFAAVTIFLTACDKIDSIDKVDVSNQQTRVASLAAKISMDVAGTMQTTVITTNPTGVAWTATSSESWCSVKQTITTAYGKTEQALEITGTANTGFGRTATVTVSAGSDDKVILTKITVEQASALPIPVISASSSSLALDAQGTANSVVVTTNQSSWNVSSSESWCKVEKNANSLVVSASMNTASTSRSAKVTLTAGPEGHVATATITVTQAKMDDKYNITVNGIEFVLVEKGTFLMGAQNTDASLPNYSTYASATTAPVHSVTITKDFYIAKYELTQAQYEKITGNNPSTTKGPNNPVEMVNWNDAQKYIAGLNAASGKTFRLPTEAEWEFAARGGNKDASSNSIFSGVDVVESLIGFAYYYETGGTQRTDAITLPVGSKRPNELGIYDMSGNVYEWCSDYYATYTADQQTDPQGPATGTNRIMRGGSWYHGAASQTVFYHGNNTADFSRAYLGFRLVYVP